MTDRLRGSLGWRRREFVAVSLGLLLSAWISGCGEEGGTPALDEGDPLHEHGVPLPPEELGLPPRVSMEAAADFEPVVAPPPFSPGIFPCSRCHEGGPPVVDVAPYSPHATHLENDLDCTDCHFPGDATEPTTPSVRACFLCHERPARDAEDAEDDRALAYFIAIRGEDGKYAFPRRWQTQDINARHEVHEEAGIECASCHGEISNEPRTKPKPLTLKKLCLDCHEERDVQTECASCHGEIRKPLHENIVLKHGTNTSCFQCHNPEDRDTLRLATGSSLSFEKSYELCGQCHGPKLRDWRDGLHGKRVGSWSGKRRYLLCVHCHQNPHQPSFPSMVPMPGPRRPEDIR